MLARDLETEQVLASDLAVAGSFLRRALGLLGSTDLPGGAGLWIRPCRGIHTFGMRFPIDVLFLDRDRRVVGLVHDLKPQRLSPIFARAHSVIELPAGTLKATGTAQGHHISLCEVADASRPPLGATASPGAPARHLCTIPVPAPCPTHADPTYAERERP